MNALRRLTLFVGIFSLIAFQSACLKTRAQLRHEQAADQAEGATEGGEPAQKSGNYQLEEIKAEIVKLNGAVEDLQHQNQSNQIPTIHENLLKLEGRVTELEKNQVLVLSELKGLKDKQAEEKVKEEQAAALKANPKQSISAAMKLLSEKKFEAASEKFKALLEAGISGKEGAECYFGLGQSYYGLKDYRQAIVTLSKVSETAPKSARIPASLLLIGKSFDKLNQHKDAKGFYAEIMERYPQSPEAKKIKSKSKE